MPEPNPAIAFIGTGAVGKGLALALAERGYWVAAVHNRSQAAAEWLAGRIPGCQAAAAPQQAADAAELLFITTPDAAIAPVAASIKWRPGQGAAHCCGAASLELLAAATAQGACAGAMHPFQTFALIADPAEAVARLRGVSYAIAGEGWVLPFLTRMAADLGGHPVSIPDADRPLYHASAILSCGYVAALLEAAASIWREMGLSTEDALRAILPLARATLDNAAKGDIPQAVTGPVVRGDDATAARHLEALRQRLPALAPLYAQLTAASLPLAQRRGVAPDALARLRELVHRNLNQPEL